MRIACTTCVIVFLVTVMTGCGQLLKKDKGDDEASETSADTEATCDGTDCVPDGGPIDGTQPPSPGDFEGNLLKLGSCDAVESAIEQKIIERLKYQAADAKERFKAWVKHNQKYYVGTGVVSSEGGRAESMAEDATDSAPSAAGAAADSSAPTDYTGTNTQVEGVDEADIVKTNGTHIFAITRNRLHIIKSWPADAMVKVASVPFYDEYIQDMVLEENGRLIVIGQMLPDIDFSLRYERQRTSVTVFDVTNPASPIVTAKYAIPGYYHSLRRVGPSVRLVMRNTHNFYTAHLRWQIINAYWNFDLTEAEFNKRVDFELERNIAITKAKDLNYWLKLDEYAVINNGLEEKYVLPDACSHVYVPTAPTELGLTSVVTLNLDAKTVGASMLLTYANHIYANENSLYFTTPYWWWRPSADQYDITYIHGFDISDPSKSIYFGSGKLPGHVINQFAMDEFEGNMRVATTVNERVPLAAQDDVFVPFWWRPFTTNVYNQVFVLGRDAGSLKIVGETDKIAVGERIFSARFNGKKGYVVTFRQIDPLFTLDLSDPVAPAVVGEVEVDGVSNYIHMMDDNHLLTVGRGDGWNTLRITVFDVTDMANPLQAHKLDLPGQSSAAQYDHKAFTFMRSKGLLALPVAGYTNDPVVNGYWWGRYRSAVMLFKVDAEAGITPMGELGMNDLYTGIDYGWYWWYGRAYVNRSIIADDFIYAISNFGVRSANIGAMDDPLATVLFTK